MVLAATAFTWVVNRPQEYVGWLIRDYSGLAIVAGGALGRCNLAVGFFLAGAVDHRPERTHGHHVPVQGLRDGTAWLFSGWWPERSCGGGPSAISRSPI